MIFNQVLLEIKISASLKQKDIKKWLGYQKSLWADLVNKDNINKNDTKTFFKFGEFFYDYVKKNGETPTLKQTERALL